MKVTYSDHELKEVIEKIHGRPLKSINFNIMRNDGARLAHPEQVKVECEVEVDSNDLIEITSLMLKTILKE